ncbi:MAG: 6-carboxy-5,6,7,8-tetrahydropterin synthase [Planctomycetota bacterium]|nr:MAG: 6-carboxy-5,6,7,8-tetrahydropterin synthase [Planctomycetota bacterium]
MYLLTVCEEFAAAHALREYDGKCARPHGHNFRVEVAVRGSQLGPAGLLMDFAELKRIVRALLAGLDHQDLNELPAFQVRNPTAEHLAHYIFAELEPRMPEGIAVDAVTVWENERSAATYRREPREG